MTLNKVEVGSALYKKGIRWIETMESEIGKHELNYMVLDYILTISMVTLGVFTGYFFSLVPPLKVLSTKKLI